MILKNNLSQNFSFLSTMVILWKGSVNWNIIWDETLLLDGIPKRQEWAYSTSSLWINHDYKAKKMASLSTMAQERFSRFKKGKFLLHSVSTFWSCCSVWWEPIARTRPLVSSIRSSHTTVIITQWLRSRNTAYGCHTHWLRESKFSALSLPRVYSLNTTLFMVTKK